MPEFKKKHQSASTLSAVSLKYNFKKGKKEKKAEILQFIRVDPGQQLSPTQLLAPSIPAVG